MPGDSCLRVASVSLGSWKEDRQAVPTVAPEIWIFTSLREVLRSNSPLCLLVGHSGDSIRAAVQFFAQSIVTRSANKGQELSGNSVSEFIQENGFSLLLSLWKLMTLPTKMSV